MSNKSNNGKLFSVNTAMALENAFVQPLVLTVWGCPDQGAGAAGRSLRDQVQESTTTLATGTSQRSPGVRVLQPVPSGGDRRYFPRPLRQSAHRQLTSVHAKSESGGVPAGRADGRRGWAALQ